MIICVIIYEVVRVPARYTLTLRQYSLRPNHASYMVFVVILSDSSGAFSVNDNGVDGFVGDDDGSISVVGNVVAILGIELLKQCLQRC